MLGGIVPALIAAESPNQRDTAKRLMTVSVFAFGDVGRGGNISAGEKDFRRILRDENAITEFHVILTRGTVPAKLYALAGIRALAPGEFDSAVSSVANQDQDVRTISGCIPRSRKFAEMVRDLRGGRFDWYLQK